jgi:hypothetical protein
LLSFADKKKKLETPSVTPSASAPVTTTFRSSRITTATHTIGRLANSNMPPLPPSTPSAYKITTSTAINSQVQHQYNNRFKSPALGTRIVAPPLSRDGVPVANRRAQRRSQSADNWLDHKPSSTVKTGMQSFFLYSISCKNISKFNLEGFYATRCLMNGNLF